MDPIAHRLKKPGDRADHRRPARTRLRRPEAGEGERILAAAIGERFTLTSSGALEPAVEGSTKPIATSVRHAGIAKVKQFSFAVDRG